MTEQLPVRRIQMSSIESQLTASLELLEPGELLKRLRLGNEVIEKLTERVGESLVTIERMRRTLDAQSQVIDEQRAEIVRLRAITAAERDRRRQHLSVVPSDKS